EWEQLGLIKEVLEEPCFSQGSFSSETEPTVWKAIPIFELLQDHWETMLNVGKFTPVHDAIKKGLEKLRKWYMRIYESDTYFICLALHPSIKLKYCKMNWDEDLFKAGSKALEQTFDSYYKPPKNSKALKQASASSSEGSNSFNGYSANWILSSLKKSSSWTEVNQDPRKELCDYLSSPLEDTTNPVKWWGYHSQQYPTLS
ncbi:hypothetical protein BYT27DRAFT_7017642, partial [Phlegmacium glaucopus]